MIDILPESDLPVGFAYPREFLWVRTLEMTNLSAWFFWSANDIAAVSNDLRKLYPERILVPLASHAGDEEIACWEVREDESLVSIIAFGEPEGFEVVGEYASFREWYVNAISEMFEDMEAEWGYGDGE